MSSELRQRVLKRQTKRRMGGSSARFGAGMRLIQLLVSDFLLAQAAAPQVGTSGGENAERTRGGNGLGAEAREAALEFQEGVMHPVFRVEPGAEKIAGDALHARAVKTIKLLECPQVAGLAGRGQ